MRVGENDGERFAAPRQQPHVDRLRVGGEQGQRRESRRADGEALANGCRGVAHRVEAVGDLAHLRAETGHLGDAASVVGDGAVGVDAHGDADRRKHADGGDADAVEAGGIVGGPDGALGFLWQAKGEQLVRNAAGQVPYLIETIGAVTLDIGDPGGVDQPAAVVKVDKSHINLLPLRLQFGDAGTRQAALLEEAQQVAVTKGPGAGCEAYLVGIAVQ